MTDKTVKSYIKQLKDLSTTPALLARILSSIKDDSGTVDELSSLISHDQAMAERVIRMANSVFFAHSGQIMDIHQAIMFLGLDRIKAIAVGMTVMKIFPSSGTFRVENLWVHGYETAFLSSLLSERIAISQPQISFLAGLLHDTGRLVLYTVDHDAFAGIETTDTMLEQERAAFGCTHAEAGAWFAEEVGLPYAIVTALRHHHQPSAAPDEMNLVAIVSLAEALCRTFRPRVEDDGIWTPEHDALLLEFSLSPEHLAEMKVQYLAAQPEIEKFFSPDASRDQTKGSNAEP